MAEQITMNRFIEILQEYPLKQVPLAARFIVNQMAYEARQRAVKEINQRFIVRNKYVPSRIQFEMSPATRDLNSIQSEMGALESINFMAKQETGWINRAKSGGKLPIPTRAARVSNTIQKKKRTKYRTGSMGNLRKINRYRGRGFSKATKIHIMLQTMALNKDKRAALCPFSNKPGIYVIKNIRRRKITGKTRFDFRMVKLYDLKKSQQKIKARPWMRPTVNWIAKREKKIVDVAWLRFLSKIR